MSKSFNSWWHSSGVKIKMSFLDIFKRKKRATIPNTLAVVGLKKALLLGMLTNPEDSESCLDDDSDRMDEEEEDSVMCAGSDGNNITSGCDSDLEKGMQELKIGSKSKVTAAVVHSSPSLAASSPSARPKTSGHKLLKGKSVLVSMSSQSSFDSPLMSKKRRATADGLIGHDLQGKKDKSSSSTTSSASGSDPRDKKAFQEHAKERRSSSYVESMFSRDAVKIRADILNSIPLTTASAINPTMSKTYTSASISSTDSVQSSPSQFQPNKAKELLVRRKSTSLDGVGPKKDKARKSMKQKNEHPSNSMPQLQLRNEKNNVIEQCSLCYQFHSSDSAGWSSPPPRKALKENAPSTQTYFFANTHQPCHACLGFHAIHHHLPQPSMPNPYLVKRNQYHQQQQQFSSTSRSFVPNPTYGPYVNQLPVPHPATTNMYYPQLANNSRMRSQSLAIENRNAMFHRRNLQRQVSVDLTASSTILEEMSSSSSSGDESGSTPKSFLSAKRASLKKKLRMLSSSSQDRGMMNSSTTSASSSTTLVSPQQELGGGEKSSSVSLNSSPARRVRVTCL